MELVIEARDEFWEKYNSSEKTAVALKKVRQRPIVAASIGSYGAFLADGSEFRYSYFYAVSASSRD